MFGNLRAGSLIYILNKGEEPSLNIGQVLSVTPPRPKVNTQFMPHPMPMEQVVDLTVKVGDDTKTFTGVNTNLSIVDTGANSYVIADDKQAIINEIEAFGTISQNALNAIGYHKKVIAACKQMMVTLNPSLQKEADRDTKIGNLEKELSEIKNGFSELMNYLKSNNQQKRNL